MAASVSTNIISLLDRLALAAPEVCSTSGQTRGHNCYRIGEYRFFIDDDAKLAASCSTNSWQFLKGRPALAWLRDALEGAIEARGWSYDLIYDGVTKEYKVFMQAKRLASKTAAEALLAAFVAAVEGGR